MENINPPVHQIYLIGPEKQGKYIACRIFPYCERCNWIPAFFLSERYTKTIEKDIFRERERTGVIAFGGDSKEIYDRLYGDGRQQKVLRLLEPGSPKPPFFFSYQAQIFSYPETEKDFRTIASWMGFVPYLKGGRFQAVYPGALHMEELCMDIDFDEIIHRYQEQEV